MTRRRRRRKNGFGAPKLRKQKKGLCPENVQFLIKNSFVKYNSPTDFFKTKNFEQMNSCIDKTYFYGCADLKEKLSNLCMSRVVKKEESNNNTLVSTVNPSVKHSKPNQPKNIPPPPPPPPPPRAR